MWRTYLTTLKRLSDQSSNVLSSVEKAISENPDSIETQDKPGPEEIS
ncbi:MAG: hypothetical protein VXY77_04975 [Pseudomonadota bacterium]|nr:hypothetical protein [Pseudomonadota bacterium]